MAFTIIDPTIMPVVAAFLFAFAVVYAILTSAKIFEKKNSVNAVIALVFGFFSIMYEPFVLGLQQYLPLATVFLIIVFFIVLLKKVFGKDEKDKTPIDLLPLVVALAIFLLLISTVGSGSLIVSWLQPLGLDPANAIFLFGVIVIILIFIAVYYHRGWPAPKTT